LTLARANDLAVRGQNARAAAAPKAASTLAGSFEEIVRAPQVVNIP